MTPAAPTPATTPAAITPGRIVVVRLPRRDPQGNELEDLHPAVVMAMLTGRFDAAWIAPITTADGPWVDASPVLYHRLKAGVAGMPTDSVILLDQLQSIDQARITRAMGSLPAATLTKLRKASAQILGLKVG